jgi:aryl-alcohol dehydrogenase-like predicted oxidoreductase
VIPGQATPEGTARYATAHPGAYRTVQGLALSTLGMGSYLGETHPEARSRYQAAAVEALRGGVNVLDTASNYRDQASERDLGMAIRRYLEEGGRRDEVVVATKAGFLHGDCDEADPDAWFQREYVASGVLARGDVLSGHSLAPRFIQHQLTRSRANLGLDTIDIHFLHNPEHQLEWGVREEAFYAAVEEAFVVLEEACDRGELGMYGVATWDGLRTPPGLRGHLSLVKLVHHAGAARMRAGGKAAQHHFRAIELPVNLAMTEAALRPTQPYRFGAMTPLECAQDLGLVVLASASLVQMRVAQRIPPEFREALGTQDDAQTAIQFARSVPGVTTALVGMGDPAHAAANARFAAGRPPDPKTVRTLLGAGSLHGA